MGFAPWSPLLKGKDEELGTKKYIVYIADTQEQIEEQYNEMFSVIKAPSKSWFSDYEKKNLKSQVKSRFYYVFWGIATIAVVAGQLYVGSGYRVMSESVNSLIEHESSKH